MLIKISTPHWMMMGFIGFWRRPTASRISKRGTARVTIFASCTERHCWTRRTDSEATREKPNGENARARRRNICIYDDGGWMCSVSISATFVFPRCLCYALRLCFFQYRVRLRLRLAAAIKEAIIRDVSNAHAHARNMEPGLCELYKKKLYGVPKSEGRP